MISLGHLFLIVISFTIICIPFSYSEISDGTILNQEKCGLVTDFSSDDLIVLFFAPLNRDQIKEQIVIYYYNDTIAKGDTIAIYETDPETGELNLIYSFEPTTRSGIRHTGITPRKLAYKVELTYKKHCLGKKKK